MIKLFIVLFYNLINYNYQKHGKIQSLSLNYYNDRGVNKCFAFINYEEHISAKKAVQCYNNKDFISKNGQSMFFNKCSTSKQ